MSEIEIRLLLLQRNAKHLSKYLTKKCETFAEISDKEMRNFRRNFLETDLDIQVLSRNKGLASGQTSRVTPH